MSTKYSVGRAVREAIPILAGLAGGTGSGKTKSMLELLKGMTPDGKRFAVIDTENGRALHYADEYDFDYLKLESHRPDDYAGAIEHLDAKGYAAIGVDSMSHEWTDGVLGWQEEEFERLGGREAIKMLSWKDPKMAHKRLVNSLLQRKAHIVLAFRAEPKTEMVKERQQDGSEKTKVRTKEGAGGYEGWFPITDSRLHFELTVYLMLLASAPGKPKPIKLYDKLKDIFPENRAISSDAGARLAEWARGGSSPVPTPSPARTNSGVDAPVTSQAGAPPVQSSADPISNFWREVRGMGMGRPEVMKATDGVEVDQLEPDALNEILERLKAVPA